VALSGDEGAQLFGFARFINGRLGSGTVKASSLVDQLGDGVVFARLAALTRDLGALNPNGGGGGGARSALRPESSGARRRDNLARLVEGLRLAGVLPSSCAKASEALRVVKDVVAGSPQQTLDFTFGLLVNLQLHRLHQATRRLPAVLGTAPHAGLLFGLPGENQAGPAAHGQGFMRLTSQGDLQRHLLGWASELARPKGLKVCRAPLIG